MKKNMVKIKRIYEEPEKSDGFRILVDRLWPRGISKEKAKINLWLKDIAPSNELRKWFGHKPERWNEFKKKYTKELKENIHLIKLIQDIERHKKIITLLYGAKDQEHNQAVVLKNLI